MGKLLKKERLSSKSGGKINARIKITPAMVGIKIKSAAKNRGIRCLSKRLTAGFSALIKINAKNRA